MRYFFYSDSDGRSATIIMICDEIVKFSPERSAWGRSGFAWIRLYEAEKTKHNPQIFEVCENQAKKFMEKGITPINVDW